ncbi:unnamed protein product [Alopecurus aequalis]
MVASFLLCLLLIASAGTAAGDDVATELPHLELPSTPDSGSVRGSDAPPLGLMDIMSMIGCGSFASLVAVTPNASEVFQERIVGGGGLTIFCPDDKAVAEFGPAFSALGDHDRLDLLLHHGAAARYSRAQLAPFECVSVRTLAGADACTNESQTILLFDDGDTVRLCRGVQGGLARVIEAASSEEGPLAVYLIDSVLLPGRLRQKLNGGDKAAACGGYLDWLHLCIPLWLVLIHVASAILGCLAGTWWARRGIKD